MKGWRTIAINVLTFLVAMFGWEDLTKFLDPQQIVLGAAVVNMALRWVTTTAVGQAPPAADSGPTPPAAHGSVVLLVAAAGLTGCAGSQLPVIADVVSRADFWCLMATTKSVESAATAIMDQVPNGTDKDKAQHYVEVALKVKGLTAPAACTILKAYEAQQAASATPTVPPADRLLPEKP